MMKETMKASRFIEARQGPKVVYILVQWSGETLTLDFPVGFVQDYKFEVRVDGKVYITSINDFQPILPYKLNGTWYADRISIDISLSEHFELLQSGTYISKFRIPPPPTTITDTPSPGPYQHYIYQGSKQVHIIVNSNPVLTPEEAAEWLSENSYIKTYDMELETWLPTTPIRIKEPEIPEDMIIQQPLIVNRITPPPAPTTAFNDSHRGVIQPIYFRVRDINMVIVHPAVTEKIAINLDAYKSKVSNFHLKIGSLVLPEIARTASGIVFRIPGDQLQGPQEGMCYILDENLELVTSGRYIMEV